MLPLRMIGIPHIRASAIVPGPAFDLDMDAEWPYFGAQFFNKRSIISTYDNKLMCFRQSNKDLL
ncbi:unnamed protein product [Bathycoccus prasinos]